jgi:REP-associated tyrosine transposase
MPSKNVLKIDIENSYYHVYARGHSRDKIFIDQHDYTTFLKLFQRYLSREQQYDRTGVPYPHLFNKLELLCFCLASNHFHLLIYQRDEKAMQTFMRGLMTSYSHYFNKKYKRSGSLFETRYKASLVNSSSYLEHITRYIHLNRNDWENSPYSSMDFYLGKRNAEWIRPARILGMFTGPEEYRKFVADYEANKKMLDELKYELANDIIQ